MPDEHSYHRRLLVAEPIHRPIVLEAIAALDLTNGSSGLDAGCGIGLQCHALACAVGDGGHVTGVDISPDLLGMAEERAKRAGLSERISYTPGDVRRLPFPDRSFDWVWSANCVGYAPLSNPALLIRELSRIVWPGGTGAILAWRNSGVVRRRPGTVPVPLSTQLRRVHPRSARLLRLLDRDVDLGTRRELSLRPAAGSPTSAPSCDSFPGCVGGGSRV